MNYKKMIFLPAIVLTLLSCQDDDKYIGGSVSGGAAEMSSFYPAPPSQWMGGGNPYYSAGYMGDVMPYYENGTFHVYFLHDAINKPAGKGYHDIHEFSTTNLATFTYQGQTIPYGGQDDADFAVGTGSLVKVGNSYYFYYTGHNDTAAFLVDNPRESVLLATSTDMKTWTKQPSFKITAPAGYYDFDFRDPQVFQNPDDGKYWMLVSTQTDFSRKAVLLKFTTTDPASGNWTPEGPLYTTTSEDNYLMMECADVFKMGSNWYMMFSENWSGNKGTHYRMATSLNGPWVKPANDLIDGEYYYAARTATDGNKRYAFGWAARKAPENDTGSKEWGGNLVIHELVQNSDGTLATKVPDVMSTLLTKNTNVSMQTSTGTVTDSNGMYSLNSSSGNTMATFSPAGKKVRIKAEFSLTNSTGAAGFYFNVSDDAYYKVVLEPQQNRIAAYNSNGDLVTRIPFNIAQGTAYTIDIIADGSVCVVYVNGKVALTNRIYGREQQNWGLIATGGATASVTGLQVVKP